MVERSRGNTVRRNRRDQCVERENGHRSGRGFYRSLFRGVELSGRPGRRRVAALGALLATFALSGHIAAAQEAPAPITDITAYTPVFEDATSAYALGDMQRALYLAEKLGNAGVPNAQVMAGHIHLRGETGLIDADAARVWYEKAAALAETDAYIALGEMALRSLAGLSPSDAMPWMAKAAVLGRSDAKRAIGEMYLKGQGITPDREKALDWIGQAADQNDAIAVRQLADIEFETDPEHALTLYERAADLGDYEAAYIAAIMLAENENKQAALLRQAAEAGHAAAQADYGLLVYQGAGTERSIEDAAKWFEKSAKAGDSEGQYLYAFTLAKGEGVEKSFEDAYFWLLRSGDSDIEDWQKDRSVFRKRLEDNVDKDILKRAKKRFDALSK